MAKAIVTCTCSECGATFEKSTTKNNRTEADQWEKWAVDNYTQCPQCWGKEQRQKELETPLTLNVNINPFELNQPIVLYFSGNTMPAKDDIKSLNYFWQEKPMTGFLGILETKQPQKCWNKRITIDDLDIELKKAESINAIIKNNVSEVDIIAYRQSVRQNELRTAEKADKLKDIKKPECPEVLKGQKWNTKIYGKSGSYCFYSNNDKISITDKQKEEIEKYLKEKEAYNKKLAEIN